MRTLRLIGTTLLMVVLCLNFTACGDDDDEEEVSTYRRLLSASYTDEDGEVINIPIEYDTQGRITKITWNETSRDSYEMNEYTYESDQIIKTSSYSYDENKVVTTYKLVNGIIVSGSDRYGEYVYSYNAQNQLIKVTDNSRVYNITWEDNNIKTISDYTFTYSNISYQPLIGGDLYWIDDFFDEVLFSQGFFGMRSKNLIKSMDRDDNYSYNYVVDSQGYVTKAVDSYEGYYQFNWQ